MNTIGITTNTDFYVAIGSQPAQLESLANSALSRGIDLYMGKRYKEAVAQFKRAVGLYQNSPYAIDAAHYMGNAYLKLGNTEKAIQAYETAISLNPYRDDSHAKLGNLLFAEGRYDEAEKTYREAVRYNPSVKNYYALGQAYLEQQRYGDAETVFDKVLRLAPDQPTGNFGLGLTYSKQGRYDDAILQFKQAIERDETQYAAYAELGYAYADSGQMDQAQSIVDFLEGTEAELADTLSRYMYKVDPPKISFVHADSTFSYTLPNKTKLSTIDAYLANANAEKSVYMIFQFDKKMDRESVENRFNWQIGRSSGSGPGQAYNYGLPIADTEVEIAPYPDFIYYDDKSYTAKVHFTLKQNDEADGTIDPAHIEFKFSGEDAFGNKMDLDYDQFTGFSGVA